MADEVRSGSVVLTADVIVETRDLSNSHVVYRRSVTWRRAGGTEGIGVPLPEGKVREQGVVARSDLDALSAGADLATVPCEYLDAELVGRLRRRGWTALWQSGDGEAPASALRSPDVFDALEADPAASARLVVLDREAERISRLVDGRPMTVGIRFSYMPDEGAVTEAGFDLDALTAHLSGRDDVAFPAVDALGEVSAEGEEVPSPAKVRVPAYNSGPGSTETVYFVWAPDDVTYARVVAHASAPADLREAVLDSDVLGLSEAGITSRGMSGPSRR